MEMDTETLLHQLEQSSAHPDVLEYVTIATNANLEDNFVTTLKQFAKHDTLENVPEQGNPVEKELWNNGIKQMLFRPLGKPYDAVPDETQKRIIELIYERRYQNY